jgi:hypothetical protein
MNNSILPSVRDDQVNISSTSTPFEVREAKRTVELPINLVSESSEGLNQKATVLKFEKVVKMQGLSFGVTEQDAAISYTSNDLLKAPSKQDVPWHMSI